jgi:O-antigen biosynthesis protein
MPENNDLLHVYQREISTTERSSLSVLASLIRPGASVLDLGIGSGALGRFLIQRGDPPPDGLTYNPAEAELAGPHYRRLEVADLEHADLSALFGEERYEYIVCADVIEHLRQPQHVLAACRPLLATGGKLLISVPNAGYAGLVAELLQGEFRYREEGLLDRTHLRFFTRRSLRRFMGEQCWALDGIELVERPIPESEFRTPFDSLPPAVSRFLLGSPDALTYQFVGSATPSAAPILVDEETPGTLHASALFTAQVYTALDGTYSETHKLTCAGLIGQVHQTLRFTLRDPQRRITQLRFDPADRPGFFHLFALRLVHPDGSELWRWDVNTKGTSLPGSTPHSQIAWQTMLPGVGDAALLLLTGDDPWFELPIPSELVQSGMDGCTLEVDAGWPMSADYWALSSQIRPLQDQIAHINEQNVQKQSALQEELNSAKQLQQQTQAALQQTQEVLRQTQEAAQQTQEALQQTQEKITEQLTEQLTEQRALLRVTKLEGIRLQTHLDESQQAVARLEQHLQAIINSKSFRATRPIVHAKMRLDRLLGRNRPQADPTPAPIYHPMPPSAFPVDVIVPVYKGLDDTRTCIESVLASECSSAMRLIAINDASPEPEVTQWLRDKAAQDPRLILLENQQNLGFVGTVNRGMALSPTNDVLLLNSDTEVANDWLDRIRRAAYSDLKIASVTPFSNNATICSYPVFCAANSLPANETTASLDKLFASSNANQVVDVPTGVGFCMYIRRDCLNDVGLFDEEHFGKGYGEENDFCQRAIRRGWRNLHALDTFVLHTGGVSFGESKSPREQAAMETLRALHPSYERQVMSFVQQDPACAARMAVDWLRAINNGSKPVVLAVLHQRGGGTERHVLELAQCLSDSVTFLSLKPSGDCHVELQLIETNAVENPTDSLSSPTSSMSGTWRAVFDLNHDQPKLIQLLREIGVAHVHVHHFLGHHQFVWDLPRLLGVSYDFTCHDFYSFCTNITLTGRVNRYQLDAHGECCEGQHPPSMPHVVEQIGDWRSRNRVFLEGARFVLSPSVDTANRMLTAFPSAPVRFAPHTDLNPNQIETPNPRVLQPQQALRVVVIGALSIIKGAEVLEATARLAKESGALLEFHLIGFGYRHLQTNGTALTVHGQYDEADLPAMLQRIAPDIAWFPALWPETYSYTLSAAFQAALPVAVPDIGAFVERVANRPWSWVQGWSSTPQQWLDLFLKIREEMIQPRIANGNLQPVAAPSVPSSLHDVKKKLGDWQYSSHYANALPNKTIGELDAGKIVSYFVAARGSNPPMTPRSRLYRFILSLQRSPMLGPLVRVVPKSWRYHVKQLLSH